MAACIHIILYTLYQNKNLWSKIFFYIHYYDGPVLWRRLTYIYIWHQDFTIKNIIQASHQNPSLGSTHYWISNALSCLPHMLQFEYAMIIFSVFSCISLKNSVFLFTKAKTSRRAFIRLQKWTRISQHYRSPTCKGYDSLQVATR